MLTKINHVGVAVKSLEESIPFYRDMLGMKFAGTEEVVEQKVRVAMFEIGEAKMLAEEVAVDVGELGERFVEVFLAFFRRRIEDFKQPGEALA